MQKLITTLTLSALVVSTVITPSAFSQGNGQGFTGKGGMQEQVMDEQKMKSGMPGQMMPMRLHMQKMQTMMESLKAETDREKRQLLMQEHMQAMQQGMQMMKDSMSADQNKNMSGMDMQQCMKIMSTHMDMMQKMMGQMSQHQDLSDKEKKHRHKQ